MLTLDETERTLLPHQRESDTVVLAIIHDRTAQMTHANINYERKQQKKRRAVARICLIDIENGKHQRHILPTDFRWICHASPALLSMLVLICTNAPWPWQCRRGCGHARRGH